jgi:hypothetical protein
MGLDALGLGSIADFGGKILDKIFPDKNEAEKAKLALATLSQQGEFKELDAQVTLAIEQIKVNAVEAANPNIFVSGWRPFVGWICGTALGYNYIVMPFIDYWFKRGMPALDVGELIALLTGMLGIGGLRTVEKLKGVSK